MSKHQYLRLVEQREEQAVKEALNWAETLLPADEQESSTKLLLAFALTCAACFGAGWWMGGAL